MGVNMNKKKMLIIVTIVIIVVFGVYLVITSNNKKTNVIAVTPSTTNTTKSNNQTVTSQESTSITDIIINKKEITNIAKFYKYKSGNIDMEVMAVKATDGSIRTALNTCQVCYDSGRGYYKQQGDNMVCQNCGNKFNINQIEKIKGGCNPVPVLAKDKTETADTITISKEYLDSQKSFFENWK
jgi:uncharacterized membrane protein